MLGDVAAFNTAALTGESVPRNIRAGEDVLAGMIVTDRVVRVKVTKPYDQSALARILEMVQNASERKAPAELFIRKFARIYTPVVTVRWWSVSRWGISGESGRHPGREFSLKGETTWMQSRRLTRLYSIRPGR